jgi:hypothetical protein
MSSTINRHHQEVDRPAERGALRLTHWLGFSQARTQASSFPQKATRVLNDRDRDTRADDRCDPQLGKQRSTRPYACAHVRCGARLSAPSRETQDDVIRSLKESRACRRRRSAACTRACFRRDTACDQARAVPVTELEREGAGAIHNVICGNDAGDSRPGEKGGTKRVTHTCEPLARLIHTQAFECDANSEKFVSCIHSVPQPKTAICGVTFSPCPAGSAWSLGRTSFSQIGAVTPTSRHGRPWRVRRLSPAYGPRVLYKRRLPSSGLCVCSASVKPGCRSST